MYKNLINIMHKICLLIKSSLGYSFGKLNQVNLMPQCKMIAREYTTSTNTDEEKEREIERIKNNASLDEPPTACCQSGCANCVFIVWAEALTEKLDNAGPEIAEKIMKMVDDPSMRAYLELELRLRGLKK